MKVHDLLDSPPCPACAAETVDDFTVRHETHRSGRRLYDGVDPDTVPPGARYCGCCGRVFVPRRAVISGPAGHWWAYSERFGVVVCKPMSKGEDGHEPPPHPDSFEGDEWADHEWGESEVAAPATVRALLLLLGRDASERVEVTNL